jgi:hypothetical protein
MRDLVSTVATVCWPCRYAHIQVYIQTTSDACYPNRSTTNQELCNQGIKNGDLVQDRP